jgi:transcription antitermination protein NusB
MYPALPSNNSAMLNRRHLRVKVLQSLYAFIQSGNVDLIAGEKELLFGIEKIYDLYLYHFQLLVELRSQAERQLDDNRNKQLPTQKDLHPKMRFVNNRCLTMIAACPSLNTYCQGRKVSWLNDLDLVRKLLNHIQQQNYYNEYLESPTDDFASDRDFVIRMIKKDVMHFELLHHFFEEKSIYWLDDWELVNKMMIKTILTMESGDALELMALFKEEEDRDFARELFHRTIINQAEMDRIIAAKTQNWDIERIALMDIIIMKMALTEILRFPEIPVKVSLNEYIELSKMYSTPKSKVFINGILDKLVEELVNDNKINKLTKGLF